MKYLPRLRQFGLACSLLAFFSHHSARSQSNPTPHVLTSGPFKFESWSANAAPGTYPASMVFQFTKNSEGPSGSYDPSSPGAGPYDCAYNLVDGTRITGLEGAGISFTGSSSPMYVNCDVNNPTVSETRFVGTAVIALNTTGINQTIAVGWTAENLSNQVERIYLLKLQYRIGTTGDFSELPNSPEYSSTATIPITYQSILPSICQNQPYVEVRWVYYFFGGSQAGSPSRPTMRLDDIIISDETTVTTPVELAYFRSELNADQSVSLRWKTILEKNSKDFRLERSTDAKTYTEIARLDAAGTIQTPKLYSFTDRSPRQGANYYRLRQVDLDGKEYLFRPSAVLVGTEGKGHAYPNPFDGTQFTVRSLAGFGEKIQLFDMARRTLRVQTTRLSELEVQVRPTERLSAGLYLLGIPAEGGRMSWQRLVVR